MAATGLEALLTGTQSALRGKDAVYAPPNLVRRLARRHLGIRLPRRSARRVGQAMRWSYGPGWGVALGVAMGEGRRGRSWPLWGLGLGLAVLAFEMILLPATGATPRVSSWRRDELRLEVLNTMAFGIAAAGILRLLSPPSGADPGSD